MAWIIAAVLGTYRARQAGCGVAGHSVARPVRARPGEAWQARHGQAGPGADWQGLARQARHNRGYIPQLN